jgi:hypothetical protein
VSFKYRGVREHVSTDYSNPSLVVYKEVSFTIVFSYSYFVLDSSPTTNRDKE